MIAIERRLPVLAPLPVLASSTKFWKFFKASALPFAGLVLILLLAAWLIAWIRNRYRGHEDHAAASAQMLLQFRELHREGDLSEEEYRSIKNRLIQTMDGTARGSSGNNRSTEQAEPVSPGDVSAQAKRHDDRGHPGLEDRKDA